MKSSEFVNFPILCQVSCLGDNKYR